MYELPDHLHDQSRINNNTQHNFKNTEPDKNTEAVYNTTNLCYIQLFAYSNDIGYGQQRHRRNNTEVVNVVSAYWVERQATSNRTLGSVILEVPET